jgi:hypothetical protein
VLDGGHARNDFLAARVNGLEEYRKSLEPFTMEFAACVCQVDRATLQRVANETSGLRVCAFSGHGRYPAHGWLRLLHGDIRKSEVRVVEDVEELAVNAQLYMFRQLKPLGQVQVAPHEIGTA